MTTSESSWGIMSDQMTKQQANRMLLAILGDTSAVNRWWHSKNRALDNKTPDEMFETDPGRVYRYILSQAR